MVRRDDELRWQDGAVKVRILGGFSFSRHLYRGKGRCDDHEFLEILSVWKIQFNHKIFIK
jgi:hypothetical protein